jgi:hypothetical protein
MPLRLRAATFIALALLVSRPSTAAYSPSSTNGWFPIVGRGPGAGGGQVRTDLWLFNPDPAAQTTVTLVFHPAVANGAAAGAPVMSAPIDLFPRETRFFPDVTASTVPAGSGAFGSLEWVSSLPVMGTVHEYLSSVSGTVGGYYGATPISESMPARASATDVVNVLQLFGLHSGDASFSTALDVANTSSVALPIDVRVIRSDATILATSSYTVAPKSLLRVGNPFSGIAPDDGLRVTVAVRENNPVSEGGILAAATVTDTRTHDANVVLGQRQSAGFLGSGPCTPDANSLCLNNGRFRVTAAWQTATSSGAGTAIPGTSDTGQFWFFSSQNVEMVVKVLNGCGFNQRYWVFAGGLTNVQVVLTVTDMANGTVKTYTNPANTAFQPIQDTGAFATCP